jgi:hypothetical protein
MYLALAVTAASAILYALTIQPTLSFWDCGEFIASAVILGVPHPPGAPVFLLIGRLFSLVPGIEDIGLRVNLVSLVSGAFAVGIGYLITTRIQRRFFFPRQAFWGREWLFFTAGVCGAGLLGFGNTVWTNSIEAEVYGITLFLFLLVMYTGLVWIDRRHTGDGARLLIFATFVAVLGLGIHMMVYLALPGFWLAVFLIHPPYARDWRIWLAALASGAVMITGVETYLWNLAFLGGLCAWWLWAPVRISRALRGWFVPIWIVVLYAIFQTLLPLRVSISSPWIKSTGLAAWIDSFAWSEFDWLVTAGLIVTALIGCFMSAGKSSSQRGSWALAGGIVAAALAAFTLQLYMPVRSAQDPRIDENDPETWRTFVGFLERKQYGRESMVTRMFRRRGEWSKQLGRHPRMGFWSFLEKQYGLKSGPLDINRLELGYLPPAFLLLVALGLFGVGYLFAVYWRAGLPLFLTLLITTVGLAVYMNFADGTHFNPRAGDQAYIEVRNRDYFFTTGFALFGICVALGVGAFLRVFLEPRKKMWKPVLVVSSAVFLFALPIKTVVANYWQNDRSRDYIPYDYAHNMLNSCEPNAILFTNGDNDTFPLWCLQEAYGVRRDVRIVNLSLANTFWYIHQLKNRLHVPLELSDLEIDALRPKADLGRIQDQVINVVLESNQWQYPVYFGASAPAGSRVYRGESLDDNLRHEGMIMRLVQERAPRQMDRALTLQRYREEYRFRSVADSTLHMNEATKRIADNYATGILFLADAFRREGQPDSALGVAAMAARLRPQLDQPRVYMAQLAGERGLESALDSLVATSNPALVPDLYYSFGLTSESVGAGGRAQRAYRRALEANPDHEAAFRRVASQMYAEKALDSLLIVLDAWILHHPGDSMGPLLRTEVVDLMNQPDTSPGPTKSP